MKFTIDSTTEKLHSTGGLALVGTILEKIGMSEIPPELSLKHPEILKVMTGLYVQARTSFEEIRLFRDDEFFQDCFGLDFVPAAETLRLYLEHMIPEEASVNTHIHMANLKLLHKAHLSTEKVLGRQYLPVDIDTSPMDNSKSHKEGVSRTYKRFDGYHPIFAYIGTVGYLLGCQLREGKQHCQKNTPAFLEGIIESATRLAKNRNLLFRLDGGNDSLDTLKVLAKSGHFFIVRHNLRREKPEYWLDIAQAEGNIVYQDASKTVYVGYHTGRTPANAIDFPAVDLVFEVTVRKCSKDGSRLLFPEIEAQTLWTNLYEQPETVIELYHRHGTSEQFHSELKTDMNIERLPSGKFSVNAMLLQIAMIAFNVLRFIGQQALNLKDDLPYKAGVLRKRLRKVIDDLIRIAVKVTHHARQIILKVWEHDPWLPCFKNLQSIFCSL